MQNLRFIKILFVISGTQVKKEFAACAIGMDLPADHDLR